MTSIDAMHLIDAIRDKDFRASKWEEDFLQSVEDQASAGGSLSSAQSRKLQEIYRKAYK